MIDITVKIDLKDFQRGLQQAPAVAIAEISKAIQKSLITVHSQALKEAPVNKGGGGGNLRQKIAPPKMTSRLRGEIVSRAPYSIYVHEGTRPHIIIPINKKVLANKRTGEIFGKIVHHPGTKPNPFFTRAIQQTKNKVDQFFKTASLNIIKEITK